MAGNAAWDRFFYPGTDVLQNKFNERDEDALAEIEYEITGKIYSRFITGDIPIEGDTAQEKLQFIHGSLLGNIYDWAGQFRDVNMSKGGHSFGDEASMGMYMRQLQGKINRTPWNDLDHSATVDQLAAIHTDLNFAHPFREGNGRASRVFMADLAAEHGVELDFSRVGDEQWNQASADTFLDPYGLQLTAEPLKEIYREIASPQEEADSLDHQPEADGLDVELSAAMQFGDDAYSAESVGDALGSQGEPVSMDDYGVNSALDYGSSNDQGLDR
ncbi:Fic/DOC family protein [Corynebacterium suicordis]|uniref:protein adenylyltransferase n=1 Tax=Corynebacterium suicordis DSM 45110 TaxID=1121369 RepID=A0ABR9ZP87_9CORY|nr:Fic family protein [Corynebacterium suicordis]MBF4554397.1 Fic family protein [Corynebacterium suicordis DSM 45110]MDR6278578.1 cell filamentation protein [Corynebacterium suicordis]